MKKEINEINEPKKKKMKKILLLSFGILFLLIGIFSVVKADVTYCCEKTTDGAWCQNAPLEKCDNSHRKVPTSCEATSYCRLGCCYDSQEGSCMENTPQKVCEDSEGVWEDEADCDIPQCNLGCCLIGNQAAFVTQIRCKRLSALYGLETNYRTDISSEIQCIATSTSKSKGACVFEKDYEKTCIFTTQEDCGKMQQSSNSTNIDFHKDYLCSDESLGTNCGPTEQTVCVEGEDEVYFIDSCGNLANIYDASKINDKIYWSKIKTKSESCNPDSGNADSASCGNCDYYLGSTCKSYQRGEDKVKPNYGTNICRDLSCRYEGKNYQHGESWCVNSKGVKDNLPGSRYFRLVCYNGEVTVEPCADFRQEYCLESKIGEFKVAGCIVNKWQSCVSLTEEDDCLDEDKGDCVWLGNTKEGYLNCTPKYSPGLDFFGIENEGVETNAVDICSQATAKCEVTYKKKLGKGWECSKNCNCLSDKWEEEMEETCRAMGDCNGESNYLGYSRKEKD